MWNHSHHFVILQWCTQMAPVHVSFFRKHSASSKITLWLGSATLHRASTAATSCLQEGNMTFKLTLVLMHSQQEICQRQVLLPICAMVHDRSTNLVLVWHIAFNLLWIDFTTLPIQDDIRHKSTKNNQVTSKTFHFCSPFIWKRTTSTPTINHFLKLGVAQVWNLARNFQKISVPLKGSLSFASQLSNAALISNASSSVLPNNNGKRWRRNAYNKGLPQFEDTTAWPPGKILTLYSETHTKETTLHSRYDHKRGTSL